MNNDNSLVVSVDESLVKLLAVDVEKQGEDESAWQTDPDYRRYLAALTSYSIDRLSHEPERLAMEKALLVQQTQDLAFVNYKSFIKTHACAHDVRKQFTTVRGHVDKLLDVLPRLSSQCHTFEDAMDDMTRRRHVTSLLTTNLMRLLEVLEIPQLMDTCVRNSYYEEALELRAYVDRLRTKFGATIRLVKNIAMEVDRSVQLMLTQLLTQFRSNIQLPACLRIVGFLRRLGVFTEAELRIKFLQSRDAWLQSVLRAIPDGPASAVLVKILDANRVHLFDIIAQYQAIFSGEYATTTSMTAARVDGASSLLYIWVSLKIRAFLSELNSKLGNIRDGAMIFSMLGQSMYFGQSLGRVGIDFRAMMVPVFEKAILTIVTSLLASSTELFNEEITAGGASLYVTSPAAAHAAATATLDKTNKDLTPPECLMAVSPLAHLLNGILDTFNELRHMSLLSIEYRTTLALRTCLTAVVETVARHRQDYEPVFTPEERALSAAMCQIMANIFIPYVIRCYFAIYPNSSNKSRNELNVDTLIVPLRELIIENSDGQMDSDLNNTEEAEKACILSKAE